MSRRKRSRKVRSAKGFVGSKLEIQLAESKLFYDIAVKTNDIEYAASLTYFFVVLYAWLTASVGRELGLILLLSAALLILRAKIERQQIKDDAEKEFEEMIDCV
jgi:hypothetical protein